MLFIKHRDGDYYVTEEEIYRSGRVRGDRGGGGGDMEREETWRGRGHGGGGVRRRGGDMYREGEETCTGRGRRHKESCR